ncbi:LacI family DNA-binding transcriptional regulator [Inquilinus limosus]|uniref:LacI family transcriptional regulator n=1 Tax=Inquilinus limosus TaxID=171674 RepID=A0A211ZVY9_9PROT|nr:LacI family DNA-binding transcriptional regulator [Inquilinus limosus]OWJ69247.1 LacI family transcriptional regulator [Inquilinus limosus]
MPGRDSTPPDTPPQEEDLASRRFVGARAVAELAGVSRSAVSRTFTPGASVSEETRQRVLAAAETLGYHVNHLARGVSRQETGIVCLVVADIDAAQPSRLTRAITEKLQDAGKVAVLLCVGGPSDDVATTLRRALNYRADATIVMSGTPAQSIVRECLDNGQRLILISRDDRIVGPDNILLDNAGAARQALGLFLRAGCRRPAVVTTELGTPSLSARADAFVEAARAVGLEPAVVRLGQMTSYDNGVGATRRLFTAAERPDAVFCVNDATAFGVIDAARHEFGLRVPEDVSVIGFDNVMQAGWMPYQLTTFDHPVDAIARHAVDLASGSRAARAAPARIELTPPLVWRRTVRIG